MPPPPEVPRAPPRSSTDSSAMPRPRIAALSNVVLTPGSPDAAPGVGNGSPSVCSTSYLGIPQHGHGNAAVVAEGNTSMAGSPGARGDAFRTGLARLFKKRWPVLEAGTLR